MLNINFEIMGIKVFFKKLKMLRLYLTVFIMSKRSKSDIYKDMIKDWGKDDVYGPWTKLNTDGKYHRYKSYYILEGGTPNIDQFKIKKL